ncbi:MAG TPA: hypothetical protein VGM82_24010 [Gemmatimonadaceae bacterium]|jgi:hypothetical protein
MTQAHSRQAAFDAEVIVKRVVWYSVSASVLAVGGIIASLAAFRPRPTQLTVTTRVGDDTVVVNQSHGARLNAMVLDQYGRRLRFDTTIHYERVGGDSVGVAANGLVGCKTHGNIIVRAEFKTLSKQFAVHCRPVSWIEVPTWVDLVVEDSTRDLALVAHGPDGRVVTELRGTLGVENSEIAGLEGTTIRPKRFGTTFANIEVGDAKKSIPLVVYEPVTSFVNDPPKSMMAIHVKLARGDTIEVPVPKATFWVTYFSKEPGVAPPTIELRGDGSCTTGDGIRMRRMEDGQYAKYCLTGNGVRMMIAHGTEGADTVRGVVAVRIMGR